MIYIKQKSKITNHSQLFYQLNKIFILDMYLSTIRQDDHRWRVLPQVGKYDLLEHELDKC